MNFSSSSRQSKPSNDLWDTLSESVPSSIDSKFVDSITDDFLIMEGLDMEDDFSGLLDISTVDAFDDHTPIFGVDTLSERDVTLFKRPKVERSLSPPHKRRRSVDHSGMDSPMSISSVISTRSQSIMTCVPELEIVEDQYKLALQHLALSMRRSEMTRNEIIRQRQVAETHAKLAAAQAKTFTNADKFLSGSSSTLTLGLEQSRSMLKSYMTQMKNQIM
jgi:hypothetical protein